MDRKMSGQIKVVAFIVLLLGIAMLVYWGMFVLQGMPIVGIPLLSELVNAGLAILCTFFLTATARAEEFENIEYFGDEYVKYMERTSLFVPYIY